MRLTDFVNNSILASVFITSTAFAGSESPSVLDDKLCWTSSMSDEIIWRGERYETFNYTLNNHRAQSTWVSARSVGISTDGRSAQESSPLWNIYDAPAVSTYTGANEKSDNIKFCYLAAASNIQLRGKSKKLFETLLGQGIPDNQPIQFVIQNASNFPTLWDNSWRTGGGIQKGQLSPLSLKAQLPYGIYAMCESGGDPTGRYDERNNEIMRPYILDRPGGRKFRNWSTDGNVDVNMTLIEEGNYYIYPERHAGLSIHDIGNGGGISPDALHLYSGDSTLPATIDTEYPYPPDAYDRLVKVDNKTRVLLTKIHYRDWKKIVYSPDDGGEPVIMQIPQLEDRYAIILLLNHEDAGAFCAAFDKVNLVQDINDKWSTLDFDPLFSGPYPIDIPLKDALSSIALIQNPIIPAGPRLIDILEDSNSLPTNFDNQLSILTTDRDTLIRERDDMTIRGLRKSVAERAHERTEQAARREAEIERQRQEAERQEIVRREAERREAEIERQRQEAEIARQEIVRREAERREANEDIRHKNAVNRQRTKAKDDADHENTRHQEEINRIRNLQDEAKQKEIAEERKRLLAEAKQKENVEKKKHQEEMKRQRTEAKTQANIEKRKHLERLQVIKRQQAEIKKQQAEAKKAELTRKKAEALERKRLQAEIKKQQAAEKKAELTRKKAEALERKRLQAEIKKQQAAEKKALQAQVMQLQKDVKMRTDANIKALQNTAKVEQANITNQMKLARVNMTNLQKQLRRATPEEKARLTERLNNAKAVQASLAAQLKEVKRKLSIDIRDLRIRAKTEQARIKSLDMPH